MVFAIAVATENLVHFALEEAMASSLAALASFVVETAAEAEVEPAAAEQVVAAIILLDQHAAPWAVAGVVSDPLDSRVVFVVVVAGKQLPQALVEARSLQLGVLLPQGTVLQVKLDQVAQAIRVNHQRAAWMRAAHSDQRVGTANLGGHNLSQAILAEVGVPWLDSRSHFVGEGAGR